MTDNKKNPMKPRSYLVTDGLERAPARGMLRAVGMTDADWVKPQIGIASSWNEITPDRKSTRLNSSHVSESRMPSSA